MSEEVGGGSIVSGSWRAATPLCEHWGHAEGEWKYSCCACSGMTGGCQHCATDFGGNLLHPDGVLPPVRLAFNALLTAFDPGTLECGRVGLSCVAVVPADRWCSCCRIREALDRLDEAIDDAQPTTQPRTPAGSTEEATS